MFLLYVCDTLCFGKYRILLQWSISMFLLYVCETPYFLTYTKVLKEELGCNIAIDV